MKSKVILVFGYQHCGTTIFKRCFGSHPDAQEVPAEVDPRAANVPWVGTPTMVMKTAAVNSPCLPAFDPVVSPYCIIRNPFDVMASLKKRHPRLILTETPKPFRMWENWARYWMHPDAGVHTVRYEDLFEDNFSLIYDCLAREDLPCADIEAQLQADPQPIKWPTVPKTEPPRTKHEAFRSWQINQPLKQRTQDRKVLGIGEFNLIEQSMILREIYPELFTRE